VAAHLQPQLDVASPFQLTTHLESIVWHDLLSDLNLPTTRAEAMSVPAVAKARHVVAPKIAGYPLQRRQLVNDPDTGEVLDDVQLPTPTWVTRTDNGTSPWHRMLWTVDDLIFTGWSLWRAGRGYAGELLTADRVGRGRWRFDDDYRVLVDDELLPDRECILIPGPHEGILTFGATAVRHARQLLDAAATAGHNPTPMLELHNTGERELTNDEIDALVERWATARRGLNGGVAYTNRAIEAKPHGSVDGHLLVEGRNAAAVDLARTVGVAAAMVDATVPKASLTYETQQGRGLEHTEYGVEPYAEAIAARLSLDDVVPRGQRMRFDFGTDLGDVQPTGQPVED
jgi:hypothetical protein